MVKATITRMLSEQQQPPAPPVPPLDPNAPPAPPVADPNAAAPMPSPLGDDPAAMGGAPPMDLDGDGMPDDPTATDGEDDSSDNDEDSEQKPEDLTQGVVDKVIEEMDADQGRGTIDLVKLAKGYLQDFGLLDPQKKYQALAVAEKLREEQVPELDKVADYIEKFLLGA